MGKVATDGQVTAFRAAIRMPEGGKSVLAVDLGVPPTVVLAPAAAAARSRPATTT